MVKLASWNVVAGMLVGAFAFSAPAAAQNMVVRYAGPQPAKFAVGSVVSPDCELAAGETLVLMTPQGTRELRGPQRVSASTRAAPKPSLLDGLDEAPKVRMAAVRSGPERRDVTLASVSQ